MVLRTLRTAFLAASILAADVVVLTLFLNPEARIRQDGGALALVVFLPYAILATALFLGAGLLASWWGWPRASRPAVVRYPWFILLTFLALVAASALYWWNLLSYRHSIPPEVVRALAGSAVGLTGAAVVQLALGLDVALFPLRGRGLAAPLAVLAAASGVVVPLALRPAVRRGAPPVPFATERVQPTRRIILVGIDGLGPSLVREGVAKGTLPVFERMLRRGAHGPLATLRPTEGPPVWTSIFTGRLPHEHGIKSFQAYGLRGSDTTFELLPKGALVSLLERTGLVTRRPLTAASRKCRALWNALNAFGIRTGVVRFWGTQPPEKVQGFMLSSAFYRLREDPARAAEALYPRALVAEALGRVADPVDVDRALGAQFLETSAPGVADDVPWRRDLVERALAPDLTYQRAGAILREAYDPPFFATYFYGLDVVGHAFLRYARPDAFGNVRPEEARRYGHVVDRYAAFLSQWVGDAEKALRPGDILLVVSGYGMEPTPLWRRTLNALLGEAAPGGTHAGAPDGFFLAVGDGIRPGSTTRSASILDVAPTVLYLMGLPVARDMEGRVLTEIVEDDFARAHPVTFVPSYESLDVTPVVEAEAEPPAYPDEEVP
jgi:predicted AlkP superfamily phosphohydrolase/phosphomutase